MTKLVPKLALALQASSPILVMICGTLVVQSVRADAEKQPGPPYYLAFVVLCIIFSMTLAFVLLAVWVWKPLGWCGCLLLDFAVTLKALYELASDVVFRSETPRLFDGILLLIALWFGLIAALLLLRDSRSFFRIARPILRVASEASQS